MFRIRFFLFIIFTISNCKCYKAETFFLPPSESLVNDIIDSVIEKDSLLNFYDTILIYNSLRNYIYYEKEVLALEMQPPPSNQHINSRILSDIFNYYANYSVTNRDTSYFNFQINSKKKYKLRNSNTPFIKLVERSKKIDKNNVSTSGEVYYFFTPILTADSQYAYVRYELISYGYGGMGKEIIFIKKEFSWEIKYSNIYYVAD